jgi:hypothetical protein
MNLAFEAFCPHFEVTFKCSKILRHGANGFTSPSEGRRAADFYRPCPDLNPRALGPAASKLSTRPQRTTCSASVEYFGQLPVGMWFAAGGEGTTSCSNGSCSCQTANCDVWAATLPLVLTLLQNFIFFLCVIYPDNSVSE